MSAGGVVLLVTLIVAAVAVVQVAIWIPLLRWLRRRSAALGAAMLEEAAGAGERVLIGPEAGAYRGGDAPYPSVKGNAVLMLTERRLACRMATGSVITVPTADIAGACQERIFRGATQGGRVHMVVTTNAGQQLGFYVPDPSRWIAALTTRVSPP